jgi:cytochrome c553
LSSVSAVAGTATYSITPSSNGTFGSVVSVTITVNPPTGPVLPVAIVTPSSQTIETGTATSLALSSSLVGTTFSWTVVQTGVTGAASGTGSSISQTLSVTGTVAGTATYSITPSANGTSGSLVSVTVTVNPVAVVSKVTYTTNIKPLLTTSCKPCHVAGGPNPKWDNYATTKSEITNILDRVQRQPSASGFMPQGGSKLSADNIALLKKWVSDGLLEN